MVKSNIAMVFLRVMLTPWILVVGGCGSDSGARQTEEASTIETSFSKPDGPKGVSSYLIEKITGAPDKFSNASSLKIAITRRNGDSQVKYKALLGSKLECVRDRSWSALTSAELITVDTSALVDGEAVLCIIAYTTSNQIDSNPIVVQWLHDVTPPKTPSTVRMTSPVPPLAISESRNVSLRWIPSEDIDPSNGASRSEIKSHDVFVGRTPGGRDVYVKSFGVADYKANITLPSDGDLYFSVAAVDNAGNETIKQVEGLISIDGTAPPAPASVTWNPAGPTSTTTGIVASWPAVQDDTAVTYQYKIGTAMGLGDIQAATLVSTNQVSLSLLEGSYFISVKAVNSTLLESSWFSTSTPFFVDLTPPLVSLYDSPNGITGHLDSLNVSISASAKNQLDVHEYMYKVITGDNCATTGVWSAWLPNSTVISDNIKGPAYETTLSICAKARDAAGNVSDPDSVAGYRVASWINKDSAGATPDFSDTLKAKIAFKVNTTIKELTSAAGSWVVTSSSAPAWSETSSRTVTGANGTIYTGSDAASASQSTRKTTVTRTPAPLNSVAVTTDLATIPGEPAPWCLGDLYLLALATDRQYTGLSDPDNLMALVSCITAAQQKIRLISYEDVGVGGTWKSYSIVTRNSATKAVGALAVNSNQLVAITDPLTSNSVYTCANPPLTSTGMDCDLSSPVSLKSISGSAGTTALGALVFADPYTHLARVVIAGPMSGTMRLGVASGYATGTLDLKWMAVELATPENFSLNPYLLQVP